MGGGGTSKYETATAVKFVSFASSSRNPMRLAAPPPVLSRPVALTSESGTAAGTQPRLSQSPTTSE